MWWCTYLTSHQYFIFYILFVLISYKSHFRCTCLFMISTFIIGISLYLIYQQAWYLFTIAFRVLIFVTKTTFKKWKTLFQKDFLNSCIQFDGLSLEILIRVVIRLLFIILAMSLSSLVISVIVGHLCYCFMKTLMCGFRVRQVADTTLLGRNARETILHELFEGVVPFVPTRSIGEPTPISLVL